MTQNSDDHDLWCELNIASDSSLVTWLMISVVCGLQPCHHIHLHRYFKATLSVSNNWGGNNNSLEEVYSWNDSIWVLLVFFLRVCPSKLHNVHLGIKHFSWIMARMMQLLFICLFVFCFWSICALIHSFSLIFRWDFISISLPHSSPFSPSLSSAPSHGLSYHIPTLTPPCFPWRLYVSWSLPSCTIRTIGLSCLIVGPGHLKIPSLPCWSLGRKRKE